MFTSPINLLVDFLFLDILSAPTPDSLKLEQQDTAMKKIARRVSSMGTDVANATRRVGRRISQASVEAVNAFNQHSGKGQVRRTLNLPESTMEAHIIASTSAVQIVNKARQENESWMSRRNLERTESNVFKKTVNLSQKRQAEKQQYEPTTSQRVNQASVTDVDVAVIRPSSPTSKTPSSSLVPTNSLMNVRTPQTIDSLFTELTVDIIQQRRYLNADEQELFDEMWG